MAITDYIKSVDLKNNTQNILNRSITGKTFVANFGNNYWSVKITTVPMTRAQLHTDFGDFFTTTTDSKKEVNLLPILGTFTGTNPANGDLSKIIVTGIHKAGNTNLTILDLGGGVGGILEHFKNNNTCVLADYFDTYLNYAESQGIKTIKGGLSEVNINPDVVILSHVIEHWYDFESEIQTLIKIQKINQTLNYIEFPGVDSLKLGRRDADFLGDIHIPHMYYFSSYVFEDIMAMFGFKKIYLDSEIKGIFLYTGIKKQTNHNNYDRVVRDLLDAEKFS